MKKIFLILLAVFCLFTTEVKSQDKHHMNYLGVSLSELIFTDFRISYERKITPSHGIILQGGYKLQYKEFTDATSINLGDAPTAWCYRNTADWYYVSLGYRFYFNPNKTIYVSPEFFYKSLQADQIIYSYGSNSGEANTYELQDMYTTMTGINLLIGKRMRIKVAEGFNVGFDVFAGASIRFKNIETTLYGRSVAIHYHDSAPYPAPISVLGTPVVTHDRPTQASLQAGLIFFTSW